MNYHMIYPANFLITNYCNQSCPFCFASKEMSSTTLDKEMSFSDFSRALSKISKNKKETIIKLLGGEPTLHTQLFDILDLAIKKKYFIQIFTNGVIGKERLDELLLRGKHIGYTFNIMTPGFLYNKKLREEVINNMTLLGNNSKMTISLTIDPYFNSDMFFLNSAQLLPNIDNIRIGLANPIAHTKNWYQFSDFPKIGELLVAFIKKAQLLGFTGTISPNCGFTRCMFTSQQYDYFKHNTQFLGWSCFGKESSMDIAVNMEAFHCFPLAQHKRVDLNTTSYAEADRKLIKERMILWSQLKKKVCITCPFYGYGGEMCPGPCLAFAINEKQTGLESF